MQSQLNEIVIATHNAGKRDEIDALLAGVVNQITSLADLKITAEPQETGVTFAKNALLKAHFYANLTKKWVIGEDSGLEVDALGGEPGVYSARYGGASLSDVERYELVLERMRDVPSAKRTARFKTVAILCAPDGTPHAERTATIEGAIATAPQGANGFGYDPIFWLPERKQTTAMLSIQQKNEISHRGQAIRALRGDIEALLAT